MLVVPGPDNLAWWRMADEFDFERIMTPDKPHAVLVGTAGFNSLDQPVGQLIGRRNGIENVSSRTIDPD